jgi:hypothetical protein
MRRYLVVANQTLGGEQLLGAVRNAIAQGPSSFYVLVPATPSNEHLTWTEGHARSIAEKNLQTALARFVEIGAEASGEVGTANPVDAIGNTLREGAFDEIILSTLPPGVSRWLKQDLPHRVERSFDLPVTHVVGEPGA